MKRSLLFLLLFILAGSAYAQIPLPGFPATEKPKDGDRLDSLLSLLNRRASKVRPYESVISRDAVAHAGLFTIYEARDSFFLELPDTLLMRDMELITRLVKGQISKGLLSNSATLPGESLDEKAVYFKPGPDSTLNLCDDIQANQAAAGSRIGEAVKNANIDPIVHSFQIVAVGKDKHSYVIDVTGFLKSPSELTNIDKTISKSIHVEYIHAYPMNVEIGIYRNSKDMPIVTNTSFIALPKEPMQQRLFDRRVGFFADDVDYFSDDQQRAERRRFILRWRLEPRPEDVERWKRGELVEPAKPIVIYIDPHTPKQWVKYLIMGVNDWQKAFEQAGFKNAIMGKEWPEGDSANLDDARYSFICYLPSEVANAYGPNVHDPRSGEIIQTHVGWYHNVMSLLYRWYIVQASATDEQARHPRFDDQLMGQLIRFVSSHEVGHTLGLAHNFGSSSRTPVEKMRDAAWLRLHGHTASIMDYARFNYVAQPEDHIPQECLWPHIGEYDRWAIQWGYKYSGATDPVADKGIVSRWVTDSLAANPRLWFGSQEGEKGQGNRPDDPRTQMEDLGDNNMTANAYGIRNLKRILPNLPAWCHEDGEQYQRLSEAYFELLGEFKRFMGHVLTNVGGVERTYKSEETAGDVYTPVSKTKQLQALAFFNEELFTTPTWLLDRTVTSRVLDPNSDNAEFLGDLQVRVLNTLLDTSIFNRLVTNIDLYGPAAGFPLDEYLGTLHKYIWGGLATGQPMDDYRRNLQKSYIGALSDIVLSLSPAVSETDYASLARTDLAKVQKEMKATLGRYTGMDQAHLESQIAIIKKILSANPNADQ